MTKDYKKPTNTTHAGADWIKDALGKELSPLGAAVADLLGDLVYGIYHLKERALGKVDWSNNHHIEIILPDGVGWGTFANIDRDTMTRLIVLANIYKLRVGVGAAAPGYFRVIFHQRQQNNPLVLSTYVPPLDLHIARIMGGLGLDYPATKEEPEGDTAAVVAALMGLHEKVAAEIDAEAANVSNFSHDGYQETFIEGGAAALRVIGDVINSYDKDQ